MKKFLAKTLSLILSLVFICGIFSACNLTKVNTEKDAKLVVAEIKIEDVEDEDLNVKKDVIYKSDLYSGYLSTGYYYVNYYGYTTQQAFQEVLKSQVNNIVVEQFARRRLVELYKSIDLNNCTDFERDFKENILATLQNEALTAISDIDLFLTEYQIAESVYEIRKSINDIMDSADIKEEEDVPEVESVNLAERTNPFKEETKDLSEEDKKTETPTEDEYKAVAIKLNISDADYEDWKKQFTNVYDLDMELFAEYKLDFSTRARRKALSSVMENYRSMGIIEKNEKIVSSEIESCSFFVKQLRTEKAEKLVSTFEDSLEKTVEKEFTDEMIYTQYANLFETQKKAYESSLSDYESAIGGMAEDTFVAYNPLDNYGFVSNLLISFSDAQNTALKEYKTKEGVTTNDVNAFRDNLAKSLVVKDQRAYWAVKGYGKYENSKFTFDDKYFVSTSASAYNSTLEKLNSYIGVVNNPVETKQKDENGVEQKTWSASNATPSSMTVQEFYKEYLQPIGFSVDFKNAMFNVMDNSGVNTLTISDDFNNIMKDIIYAFSTDAGSLTTYKGYVYSPNTNTYVPEFAQAAKALCASGVGSYTMVVSEYGLHIMVCTSKIQKNVTLDKVKFMSELSIEGTEAYRFKKAKFDSLVQNKVQKELNNFINTYLDNDSTVKYYKPNYSDLV